MAAERADERADFSAFYGASSPPTDRAERYGWPKKECAWCRSAFTPRGCPRRALYCGAKCRAAAVRERARVASMGEAVGEALERVVASGRESQLRSALEGVLVRLRSDGERLSTNEALSLVMAAVSEVEQ